VLDALLAGVVAGYAIAIPVGAIAALLITLGAQHGARVAAGGALGAATVDGLYATVAVTAGAVIAPLIARIEEPLRWISVVVLVVLGIVLALPAFRRRTGPVAAATIDDDGSAIGETTDAAAAPRGRTTTFRRLFLTVGALTLVNPVTVVYFAALVGSSTLAVDATVAERFVFVLAAFAASLSWQLLLTTAGSLVGRVLTGPTGARVTALVGGALVIALAVRAALVP
jgi:arginine exporter protein ArgO